jgi:TetR/AcrR family transcriptional regulator, mexJK operon transcriptional repressor
VFLDQGFAGASMDAIASLAGVSKPTVYKHFADKQQLFAQIVRGTIDRFTEPFYDEVVHLKDSGDVEEHLRDLARRLLAAVMQPQLLQLRRLVIGEAGRLPELGRTYEQRGPERAISALTTAFERLEEKGVLRLDDPSLAAAHFNWLVLAIPLNHAMISGEDRPPGEIELQCYADTAVRVFLAAYLARRGAVPAQAPGSRDPRSGAAPAGGSGR